ncbi:MAG: DNRLRE domain-containing protein [Fuerstiella sp.]
MARSIQFIAVLCLSLFVINGAAVEAGFLTLKQGVDGYTGTRDAFIDSRSSSADVNFGTHEKIVVDGTPTQRGLLSFTDVIRPGWIPLGSTIHSATLTVFTSDPSTLSGHARVYRMLADWDDSTITHDNAKLNGNTQAGIQTDGLEAVTTAIHSGLLPTSGALNLDMTADVQSWADGGDNFGWLFYRFGDDQWDFWSSEAADANLRPSLSVNFTAPATAAVPEPASAATWSILAIPGLLFMRRRFRQGAVAPDGLLSAAPRSPAPPHADRQIVRAASRSRRC